MFTQQDLIIGLQECYCTSSDVVVYPARSTSVDVTMYDGEEALFKTWVSHNVPLGIYVHVEKRAGYGASDTPIGIRFTHDYTVELCKHRYEES